MKVDGDMNVVAVDHRKLLVSWHGWRYARLIWSPRVGYCATMIGPVEITFAYPGL